MKIIIKLFILGISTILFSCNKESNELKDFYLNQDRNSDLIGEFLNLNDSTIWEFRNNGEHYGFKLEDEHKSFQSYWYSDSSVIYELNYGSGLYKSEEYQSLYWLSPEKYTLFIQAILSEGVVDKDTTTLIRK